MKVVDWRGFRGIFGLGAAPVLGFSIMMQGGAVGADFPNKLSLVFTTSSATAQTGQTIDHKAVIDPGVTFAFDFPFKEPVQTLCTASLGVSSRVRVDCVLLSEGKSDRTQPIRVEMELGHCDGVVIAAPGRAVVWLEICASLAPIHKTILGT